MPHPSQRGRMIWPHTNFKWTLFDLNITTGDQFG